MVRPPTGRLAVANRVIREAAVSFDVAAVVRRHARRGIEAVDRVLEAVEQHHLAGHPRRVPPLPEWIVRLEQEGGLSVPAHILELTNTVRLHGALMDWQRELLDAALPGRAQLARADDEDDAHRRWLDVA
ncbi:MAG: hypothetical protein JWM18_3924 [Chloroflexi bacterium]|nr:hypothetical protein [Chloroflexota bacterium]